MHVYKVYKYVCVCVRDLFVCLYMCNIVKIIIITISNHLCELHSHNKFVIENIDVC
jgi:hypothetical protein